MSKLRKNTATVLWILVFAFIATIIFSWGMGGFKGSFEPGVLAKVNGDKILRDTYDQALQNRFAYERQASETELSEGQVSQIRNEIWDMLVNDVLLNQAREKAGISVTDQEVAITVQTNPPSQIVNSPNFRDSLGQFDWALYRMILSDPENLDFVLSIEQSTRQSLLQQKMLQRIGSVTHVSQDEVLDYYVRENSKAKTSFINVPYKDMVADTSLITEADLRSAYRERKEEFKKEEIRRAEFILIADEPSMEDSVEVFRMMENLKARIVNGESFSTLAGEYGEDGTSANGGDLGWFDKNRMVDEFTEIAFNSKLGEVVGPIKTRFGYHLIIVDDRRVSNGEEEIKARHILMKVERSPETLEDLRARADGFRDEAEESNFKEAAQVYNIKIDTLDNIRQNGMIPRFGRNKAASEFLFNRPKGSISPVYSFRQGFIVMRVFEVEKEGYKEMEEVEKDLYKDLLEEQQVVLAGEKANELYGMITAPGGSFAKVSLETAYKMKEMTREFKLDEFIPNGVGRDYAYGLAAFDMNVGDISAPVKGERGYYIIRLDEKVDADTTGWEEKRDQTLGQMLRERQNLNFKVWMDEQRAEAKIEDFRYLYYTNY